MRRGKGGLQVAVSWKDDEGGGGAQGAPRVGLRVCVRLRWVMRVRTARRVRRRKGMKGEDTYLKVC